MVRTVKEEEYAGKRNAILDVVQRLVYTKGYEQMTIQDLLDDLQISKGAFYHYFDSKPALLEALIERMLDETEQLILPIVHDQWLGALAKLQCFFDTLNQWKIAQKGFLLALLRVWYTDNNAIVRQKLLITGTRRILPLLSEIIRQGVQEGVFMTSHAEEVGEVALVLMQGLSETLSHLLLSFDPQRDDMLRVERTVAVYTDALERVLGLPSGSLSLAGSPTLKEWFVSPQDAAEGHSTTVSERESAIIETEKG
jgi:AcrR family transcriptional regulator